MKILIVDDHPIVRSGLRQLLAAEAEEIQEAAAAQPALGIFRTSRPSLIILDLNLPGISGLELIERMKAVDQKVQILVLSMHDDPMHVRRALQAGAAGYVTKNARPDEIIEAVRRVGAGGVYVEHSIAEELVFWSIQPQAYQVEELSNRELEVVRLMASGCSLSQIASALGVSQKTAANTSSRVKTKLGARTTADLIRIALRSSLIDRDADSRPDAPGRDLT
ncbi:MAG TPA: response regulator transcription factor [Bradyrhizobium sp.]|nr:response regulator transcription factor [Bradyrhizobium sp.]